LSDDVNVEPGKYCRPGRTYREGEQEEPGAEDLSDSHHDGENGPYPAPHFVVHVATSLSGDDCRGYQSGRGDSIQNGVPSRFSLLLGLSTLYFLPRWHLSARSGLCPGFGE